MRPTPDWSGPHGLSFPACRTGPIRPGGSHTAGPTPVVLWTAQGTGAAVLQRDSGSLVALLAVAVRRFALRPDPVPGFQLSDRR